MRPVIFQSESGDTIAQSLKVGLEMSCALLSIPAVESINPDAFAFSPPAGFHPSTESLLDIFFMHFSHMQVLLLD